jgi:hypothetical protein
LTGLKEFSLTEQIANANVFISGRLNLSGTGSEDLQLNRRFNCHGERPWDRAVGLAKFPLLKSALPKKPDASAKKPNCFPMGLYAMPLSAKPAKPRPALT